MLAFRRRARDRWLASRRVIRDARAVIEASRRRVSRSAKERVARENVREGIRARLAAGELPLRTGSAWAGTASGDHACACCGHAIEPGRAEYRFAEHPGLRAHRACFAGWAAECAHARAGFPPGT